MMGRNMNGSKRTSVGLFSILTLAILFQIMAVPSQADTVPGVVLDDQKISQTEGNFTGILADEGYWATSVTTIGDLDKDGTVDLAIGDWNPETTGAIWILFMNPDGTVRQHQKISNLEGGFTGQLDIGDNFGFRSAAIGDLDGDGILDLAVGASLDDDGGPDTGTVWILFLNADGTVKTHQKINDSYGNNIRHLDDGDAFGLAVACLGDLDGDNVVDIAVCAGGDDDGGYNSGALWILFLNSNGTVNHSQKISNLYGNFTGTFNVWDYTGLGLSALGDLDGDGVSDLAVASSGRDEAGLDAGGVWIFFLNADGTVKSHQLITENVGGFTGDLDEGDYFGRSVAALGDINGDNVTDLAVGATKDDDGGTDRGAIWILFLNTDGTVVGHQKISATEGSFTGALDDGDRLGTAVACLGDFNGDHKIDIAVGANGDDDGGPNRGAIWLMFLDGAYDLYGAAVEDIQAAREAKLAMLDAIDAAIEKELAAIDALGDIKGNSGNGTKKDIVQARNRIRIAIVQQKISQFALRKSIRELDRALELLNIDTDTPDWPDVPDPDNANPADINRDGQVNILDLSLIMENWLAAPEP